MNKKAQAFAALAASIALMTAGCAPAALEKPAGEVEDIFAYVEPKAHAVGTAYEERAVGFQLEEPAAGEEIAVLHTTFGKIAVRLFPEGAPKTVENFKALIKSGYYDGLSFHRIIDGFMVQTGDPNGDSTGGESSTGEYVADEFDQKLLNLRGALSMSNPGVENRGGSQFFINQKRQCDYSEAECAANLEDYKANYSEAAQHYKEYYEYYSGGTDSPFASWEEFFRANYFLAPLPGVVPQEVWDLYNRVGGNIHLDGAWRDYGGHTVFGQVFDGMDVVDAIAAVQTDEENAPLYKVIVEKAELVNYDPATYEKSTLLSPDLEPVEQAETEADENAPAFPLGEEQRSTAHKVGNAYPETDYGFQLEPPAAGEEIAVLHTTAGDIKMRLFPDGAPATVARFATLIRTGAYDGVTFDYILQDLAVQVDGSAVSKTDGYLPDECDQKLLNLRGAVAMANMGLQNTGTAQFFINSATASAESAKRSYWEENAEMYESMLESTKQQLASYYIGHESELAASYGSPELYIAANLTLSPKPETVPEKVWDLYEKRGGNIHLDGAWRDFGGNTVFAQVFEGMDAVDAIAAGETDTAGAPVSPVTITKAEIVKYEG